MGKKIFILILLSAFVLVANAWAQGLNNNAKPFSSKKPFAAGEIIVKFNKSHKLLALAQASGFSIKGSITDQVEVKKLFKKNNTGKMTAAAIGMDKIDEPGVYKLTYKNREDIYTIVDELKKDPDVEYAEPNYIYQSFVVPNDPSYSSQWGAACIGAPAAWDVK